jgi:hypothetical protein
VSNTIQIQPQKTDYKLHDFYKSRKDAVNIAIENKLPASCWCLWSFLNLLDPFGDRDKGIDLPSSEELAEILGFSHRQIKRAIAKLQILGMWNFNFTQLRGRNLYGSRATEELTNKVVDFTSSGEETSSFAFDDKNVQNDDKNVQNDDKNVQSWTKMSKAGQKCPNEVPDRKDSLRPKRKVQ